MLSLTKIEGIEKRVYINKFQTSFYKAKNSISKIHYILFIQKFLMIYFLDKAYIPKLNLTFRLLITSKLYNLNWQLKYMRLTSPVDAISHLSNGSASRKRGQENMGA